MNRAVEVLVEDPRLRLAPGSAEACLRALDACAGLAVPPGSLAVAFVDPANCCRLHGEFFGDPEVTDVMTFPGDPEDGHAGDIAICPAVAAEACAGHGLSFAHELTLYLVHAWLHLAGLDDRDPAAAARMRAAEAGLMAHLRDAGSLLDAGWPG
jgi:probable rRNA maturation factor